MPSSETLGSENVHRMRSRRNHAKECLDRTWQEGLCRTLRRKILHLLAGRQFAERAGDRPLPRSRTLFAKSLTRVPAVSQPPSPSSTLAHRRFPGEDSLESRAVRWSECRINPCHGLHPSRRNCRSRCSYSAVPEQVIQLLPSMHSIYQRPLRTMDFSAPSSICSMAFVAIREGRDGEQHQPIAEIFKLANAEVRGPPEFRSCWRPAVAFHALLGELPGEQTEFVGRLERLRENRVGTGIDIGPVPVALPPPIPQRRAHPYARQ